MSLKDDWQTHPCLRHYAYQTLEEMEAYLKQVHLSLIGQTPLNAQGYLYQLQTREVKRLKKELEECRQMNNK